MRQQLHCVAKCANNCIVLQRSKLRACKWTKGLMSRIPFAWNLLATRWQAKFNKQFYWQKLQNLFDIFAVILYSTRACFKGKCPWQRTILWKWQRFAVFLKKFNAFFVERSDTKHFKTKSKRRTQKKFQKFQKNIGKTVDTKGEL